MISQHIPKDDPVHKMDVELAIRDMFTKAPADVAPGRDPEKIAMQIAQARRRTEVERGIFVKDEKKKEHLEYLLYNPAMRDPAILNAGYSVRQFDARVDKLIAGDKEEITPNSYDRAVADVLSRQNGANALTEVLSKVLEYGVPKDAPTLRAEREEMIDMLVTGIGYLSRPPGDQVNALFAVFAHREVEALLKTDAPLPPSLPEIASQAREMMSTRMRQLFSQVEKYAFTPGHLKALDLVDKQVRRPGLDKGPSRGGPEL